MGHKGMVLNFISTVPHPKYVKFFLIQIFAQQLIQKWKIFQLLKMEDFSAFQNGRFFNIESGKGLTFEMEDFFVILERKESQLQHSEDFLSFQIERFASFDTFRAARHKCN